MSLSNYAEGKILDHLLGTTAWTMPTQVYVSLHSADPGETGASELAATLGYARQAADFAAASGGATSNSAPVVFTNSGGGAWAAATHFGLWDAASGGNFLGGGALAATKTIGDGDTGTFAAGDLDVTLD